MRDRTTEQNTWNCDEGYNDTTFTLEHCSVIPLVCLFVTMLAQCFIKKKFTTKTSTVYVKPLQYVSHICANVLFNFAEIKEQITEIIK